MRKECAECRKPIMIIESNPIIQSGDIVQVTQHGCLNEKCSKYKIVTNTTKNKIG